MVQNKAIPRKNIPLFFIFASLFTLLFYEMITLKSSNNFLVKGKFYRNFGADFLYVSFNPWNTGYEKQTTSHEKRVPRESLMIQYAQSPVTGKNENKYPHKSSRDYSANKTNFKPFEERHFNILFLFKKADGDDICGRANHSDIPTQTPPK